MDQHRDVFATGGRQEAKLDRQADRAQLRDRLDELHKVIDRLHAMKPEYQELIQGAQQGLRDAHALEREINTFAVSLELPLIPR